MRMRVWTSGLIAISAALALAPLAEGQGRHNPAMKRQLLDTFDMSNATIDIDDLLAPGVPKDGIPALTDPEKVPASRADFPSLTARVVSFAAGGEAVAYPIQILNWHEAVNDVVGGVPIVATYCPLCDSAGVSDRRVTNDEGEEITLEFGISGFLHNSNMVMYDQQTMGIWSQVYMRAMTGSLAGTQLKQLPMRVESFGKFLARHPNGQVMTKNTGHERRYDADNPYAWYFNDPDLVYHEFEYDDRLPPKTLGAGVRTEDGETIFVTVKALDEKGGAMSVNTGFGDVSLQRTDDGLAILALPDGVHALQTFYHSWAAFFPETRIIAAEGEAKR